ncbi:hypothetical protein [Chelativorans intermedius]|uniref:Uncharacterized protein n=1 Tax=Chelativorans intermedius TaxID=515947 RepID=A0ABV6D3X3_9HYPH|nr:hypothetical protein [Chelativorans intermedius]MCT8997017.1 hypothetical protein [Chelativorans intermedius]
MKLFRALRARSRVQGRTPRQKLENTMPGETGALAALRLGFLIN